MCLIDTSLLTAMPRVMKRPAGKQLVSAGASNKPSASKVMKRPSSKRLAVAGVMKKPSASKVAAASNAESSANTRSSSGIVLASSLEQALAHANQQSWMNDTSYDVNDIPSPFAVAVAHRFQFRGLLPSNVDPHRVQSLLNEAEAEFAHAHHMLDVDNCRTHHILKYMSDKLQSSFGSVCDWMNELRFIYTSC